jgi:putative nucleotidyltransferase with HDIG domain
MKFDTKIFSSKIARRIFVLFVSCALLPIFGLSIISYGHVAKQLNEQSYQRLKQSVKGHGLSIYERLIFIETELQFFASSLKKPLQTPGQTPLADFNERLAHRFKAVDLFNDMDEYTSVFKTMDNPKKPGVQEIKHMNAGNTAISILNPSGSWPRIFMMRRVDSKNLKSGFLIGEINPAYLWGIDQGNALPPNTEVCVLDESKNLLFSSFSNQDSFSSRVRLNLKSSASGQFEWVHENEKYLVSYRKFFMKPRFLVHGWTVALSQSKADVLAPMSDFKTIFSLVVLMSLWVVLLFSIYYIRKSMVPLELLKKGTRRIAMKDFDYRVQITSRDEFEELATDFNEMSDRLNRQFKALDTIAEIDRAILSSLETRIIVETVINRMYDWFACDFVAISLIDSDQNNTARAYFSYYNQKNELCEKSFEFSTYGLEALYANPGYLIIHADKNPLPNLSPFVKSGIKSFLILPIFLNKKLSAVITIGRLQVKVYSEEDITRARQMADQVAVALSNANLIKELDQLNWGTLKALARTVDAKSSWTAGHSERVTDMALEIGAVLGLTPEKLDNLHRGALLHDIGKIGVPVAVLDKPGKLDDEEYRIIKMHPQIGAKILEPIAAYKEIVPIVLQHHERHDGKGYPAGLSGDAIDIGARILAVADVFDALTSDRPYREGWVLERVIDLITQEAGRQFDPDVVEAFLEIMKMQKTKVA